jgi:hypothetical protein
MLLRYQNREPGYGLMRMHRWVKESHLPEKVKFLFILQYGRGWIHFEDFTDDKDWSGPAGLLQGE